MKEVNVYILGSALWVKTFPKILESIVSKGIKVQVACDNETEASELDNLMWTFEQLSFLPHALDSDENMQDHPIIISAKDAVFNNSDILAIAGQEIPSKIEAFSKALIVYDPKDHASKGIVSRQISALVAKNFNVRYFKQTDVGGWEIANSL